MASVQGIIRLGGTPASKIYYTAYYRSANGGSSGPGDGQRASQWMRAVQLTEATGLFTVALSSDIFLGAGATVANGDQVVIIAWTKTTETPAQAPGTIFYGQRWQDGKSGTHVLGFKYDNGSSAEARYGEINQMVTKTFTMTGQAWNATPGGIGGDANGDISLGPNAAPTANISNISTLQSLPTGVTRGVSVSLINASQDDTTNKLYTFNSQILLEQCSAAHNPSGGTQTPDASDTDGSKYYFFDGLEAGQPFGTLIGGDAQGTNWVSFAGPSFPSFSHIFPHIDLYRIALQVKDDNSDTPLTHTSNHYVKVWFTTPTLSFQARQYASWAQFSVQPTDSNPNWSTANPNTVADVVRVRALITNPDDAVGRIGAETRLLAPVTLNGGSSFTINQAGIGALLPGSAPFGYIIFHTWSGQDVRHSYRVIAKTNDSVTIDTKGSTLTYTARDWFYLASEPSGGTDLTYNWEVSVSGGAWAIVGIPRQVLAAAISGTTITITGIGQNVCPGWWFRVIDGPARGYYQIASVANDNRVILTTPISGAAIGDSVEVTCRDHSLFWPQAENDALDFRATASYSRGWPSSGGYTFSDVLGPVVNSGSVSNLPPQGIVSSIPDPGVATTYLFDGRKSYGTQTTWEQSAAFTGVHNLDGSTAFTLSDFALNTATLRDGHAWLVLFDAADRVQAVFPIVDLDRETPDPSKITIDTRGSTMEIQPGQKFRTTNVYEIEPPTNLDNDITSYAWRLRSAAAAQTQPTTPAEFEARFDRVDGSGSGAEWSFTFTEADNGRAACIELTVVDAEGTASTVWSMFTVVVEAGPGGGVRPWRIEWE